MGRIILKESQLKRIIENETLSYSEEWFDNQYNEIVDKKNKIKKLINEFYSEVKSITGYDIMENLGDHKSNLEKKKLLDQQIRKIYDTTFNLSEKYDIHTDSTYHKWDRLSSEIDSLSMDYGEILEVYESLIDGFSKMLRGGFDKHYSSIINISPD